MSSSPLNKSPPLPKVPAPEHDERPERMRDWICRMVDSSRFHGLEWINPDKTVFRVPWIHAKKRGYCKERDAALFREWALHSGKYRDESDPTVWKINFRCAINGLKDIMEIKDLQTEDCRVYKVLPSRRTRRKPRRRFPNVEPYGPIMASQMEYAQEQQYNFSVCAPPMTAAYPISAVSSPPYSAPPLSIKSEFSKAELSPCPSVPPTSVPTSYCLPPYSVCTSLSENTATGYYAHLPCGMPSMPVQPTMHGLALNRQDSPDSGINVDAQHSPIPLLNDQPQNTFCNSVGNTSVPPPSSSPSCPISPYASPRPFSAASSPLGSDVATDEEEDIKNIIEELSSSTPSPSPLSSPSDNKMDVQVYYGSIPVFRETVSVTNGCRIFFDNRFVQPPPVEGSQMLFGPAGVEQIMLPECHPNPYAKEIFNAMSRGLIIEMVDDSVYATPLCRPVVYTGPNSGAQSYPLGKESRTKVFDYAQHFRPNLERYALSNGAPPSAQTLFSLGQPWGPSCPAGNISQTLVSILVTHCKAQNELDTIGLPAALTQNLFVEIPDAIDIGSANVSDIQAEEFLTQQTTTVQ